MEAQDGPCGTKFHRSLHPKNVILHFGTILWHSQSQVSFSLYMSYRARLLPPVFVDYKPSSIKSRTKSGKTDDAHQCPWMVRQLSPTKGTMCSTEWCVIQMANSKVRNTPGNSSWTSVVSHFHERPTSVHSQPVLHFCRWHKFTYCWLVDCVKLCHSQRWPWCSSNLGRQVGNAIQCPKEQTSFDRK